MFKNILFIIFLTLILSSCVTKGCFQPIYFVNGIKQSEFKVGDDTTTQYAIENIIDSLKELIVIQCIDIWDEIEFYYNEEDVK